MNKKLAILWAFLPLAFMLIFNSIKCLEFRSKLEHMNDTIPNLEKHCMYSTIMGYAANIVWGPVIEGRKGKAWRIKGRTAYSVPS